MLSKLYERALALHQAGNLEAAEKLYRQILEMAPDSPAPLHMLGLVAYARGAFEQAADLIEQAREKEPENPQFAMSLGTVLNAWGKNRDALAAFDAAEAEMPDSPDLYNNKGITLRALSRLEDARDALEHALELDPDHPYARLNLGFVQEDMGDPQAAETSFRELASRFPDDGEARLALGTFLRRQKHVREALEHLDIAARQMPFEDRAHVARGIALEMQGRDSEALTAYDAALSCNPNNPDAHTNRGNVLSRREDTEAAIQAYNTALSIEKNHLSALENMGRLYQKRGQTWHALETYRKALQIKPDLPEVQANLGLAVLDADEDPQEAVGLFFNALQLDPSLHELHHHIARALYKMHRLGRLERARGIAENWARQYPDNPIARHMMGALSGEQKGDITEVEFKTDGPSRPLELYEEIATRFDILAENYEAHMENLDNKGPAMIRDLLAEAPLPQDAAILDAGCGTGLLGEALRPLAKRLEGVDLSASMLAIAEKRNLYDALHHRELITFLQENETLWDLMAAGDVVCYIGALESFYPLAARRLNPGGTLIFTAERHPDPQKWELRPSGRYAHGEAYLKRLAEAAGFQTEAVEKTPLRLEYGKPLEGVALRLKKQSSS